MALSALGAPRGAVQAKPPPVVVHRGNLDIYTTADLAKLANVTHIIGDVNIGVPGKLHLPNLVKVEGDLGVGSNVEIVMPRLEAVTGGLTFAGDQTMKRVSMPKLQTVGGNISLSSASYPLPKLATVELPLLSRAKSFSSAWSGLRTLSLPKLKRVDSLAIADNKALSKLELPALASVRFSVTVANHPKLLAGASAALKAQLRAAGVSPSKLFISR